MEGYWNQILENVVKGANHSFTAMHKMNNNTRKYDKMPVMSTSEDDEEVKRSKRIRARSTRRNIGVIGSPKQTTPGSTLATNDIIRKTVDDELTACLKNMSLTSDEGIDLSQTHFGSTSSTIPKNILRPQNYLDHNWTFWYSVGNKRLTWKQNQIKISTVSTAEQFWYVVNQLKSPSRISLGHTYSVFKDGIMPDWEDISNIAGGKWMISSPRKDRRMKYDKRWQEILSLITNRNFKEFSNLVNGVEACTRRQGDRLEVWIKDVETMKGVLDIGRLLKERMVLDIGKTIKFSIHREDKEGVKGPRMAL